MHIRKEESTHEEGKWFMWARKRKNFEGRRRTHETFGGSSWWFRVWLYNVYQIKEKNGGHKRVNGCI